MTIHLSNGLGGSTGDSLALASPLMVSKTVYYVSSTDGSSSNDGRDRLHPLDSLATVASALSGGGGTTDSIVVLMDGHAETFSAALAFDQRGTIIVGEGSTSGVPTVTLTHNHASANLLNVTGNHVEIRNVKISVPAQAASGYMINVNATHCFFKNVHIDVDENNDAAAVFVDNNAAGARFNGCKFVSTETTTTPAARPYTPFVVDNGATHTGLYLEDCTFDGGATGFKAGSDFYALYAGGTINSMFMQNLSLLRGAGIKVGASSTGYIHVGTATGHAEVEW